MFSILQADFLARDIKRFRILAPRVARAWQPGQFVVVRVHKKGERIPLTVCESEPATGVITLIVKGVGKTTQLLNHLEGGDAVRDLVGPLGKPSDVRQLGTVIVVAGGVGVAVAYPVVVAMKRANNRVTSIVGAQTARLLILESEMRAASDFLVVTTDDGSRGRKGFVTQALRELLEEAPKRPALVHTVGPLPMMKAVSEITRQRAIPTVTSINSIMIDGTGMCGGCRVAIGNKIRFACVDGPEFDAHRVDFEFLIRRSRMYRQQEQTALKRFQEHPEEELERIRQECRLAKKFPELMGYKAPHNG